MGAVKVKAYIQNVVDVYEASLGTLSEERVRIVSVEDALIDSGATMLSLPKRMIDHLGLMQVRERKA